ncbi:TspO/MBR family protein [uncultured archaeon]|nr:TspO/MBR family protein [uncultured archaeon]
MAKQSYPVLAGFILLSLSAGAIGSLFTFSAIPTWYAALSKPAFAPPNWVFGLVWTTLYIFMGIAAYLVWQKGWKEKPVRAALMLFGIQLILNALWSILFFGLRSPLYGLIGIIPLWASIALCINWFYKIDRRASYLFIPYFAWVTFASMLNAALFLLN